MGRYSRGLGEGSRALPRAACSLGARPELGERILCRSIPQLLKCVFAKPRSLYPSATPIHLESDVANVARIPLDNILDVEPEPRGQSAAYQLGSPCRDRDSSEERCISTRSVDREAEDEREDGQDDQLHRPRGCPLGHA